MSQQNQVHLKVLPTGKPHISFSELNDWISCSWRHKLKNIDKLYEQRPSPIPMFGTIIHSANEYYLKHRIMQTDVAITKIKTTWNECRNRSQEDLKLTDLEYTQFLKDFNEKDQEKFEKDATIILAEVPKFLDDNFPNWEFIDAEHMLYENLDDIPYAFKGYIDGIIKCDGKRKNQKVIWLLDWKTSSFGWVREKKEDPLVKQQIVFYKYFYAKKHNIDPKDIRVGFAILKRSAKIGTHCELFTVSVGDVTVKRALKYIRNMLLSLEKGIALKNKFNCVWCDFYNTEHCDAIFRIIK